MVFSPTDVTKHLACAHLTTLDLAAAGGEINPPEGIDEALGLVFRLGLNHEHDYLERLKAGHAAVVDIPDDGVTSVRDRAAKTLDAMRAGADVIYQATFFDDGHRGHADFLLRMDRPSTLGTWSYDVADTKLARRMKVPALVQMADYGRHLMRLQGAPPVWLTVVTGDGQERPYRYADVAAYAGRALGRLHQAVRDLPPTRPEPVEHCAQCRWSPRCQQQWREEDHLSLVAFMRRDHRHALEESGVATVEALAATDPAKLPTTIGEPSRVRLQAQAALQVQERRTGKAAYELLAPAQGLGLLRLPEPSGGDVYLDFEGDPYSEGGEGREYLAGLWDRDGNYVSYWAHSKQQERGLTAALLTDLVARLDADPSMHVYHYAPYERSALARLTQRHGVAEAEFDRLLRGEVLVDLYGVVRQGLRISKGSYSIKKLEAFYWGGVRGSGDQPDDVADALASVVAYEQWLVQPDQSILDAIEAYNRDDVRSTHDLHAWLEERRTELEGSHGPQPRPQDQDGKPSPALSAAEAAEAALADQLERAGHSLLAGLVGWHRREAKPQWWDFYRLRDLTDDELVDDSAAVGLLGPPKSLGALPPPRRSTVWRYRFPPQETKIRERAADVDTHGPMHPIVGIDAAAGWLDVTVQNNRHPLAPRGLGTPAPVDVRQLQDSVQRTAAAVLSGGRPVGQLLLERVVPADLEPRRGETPRDVVLRVGRTLRNAVLAVQGPPGSGKTRLGGELIRHLLDDGLRVGVTAQSHAVIGNLLREVNRSGLQKCEGDEHCGVPGVDRTSDNAHVVDALATGRHRLVGGTAWLWARQDLAGLVDVLVVDEAGQFSLANTVAVAPAATRGLVLLGDPQQLAQPSQAQHPDGAGVSALEHLLDGAATMPADRGVFLDQTWRLAPPLAAVVSQLMYDGRLDAAPGLERQRLDGPDPWSGSGVRWVPVEHIGNGAASSEEVDRVAGILKELLECTWTDCHCVQRPVTLEDVLIVAPYNAHVGRLRAGLPSGARVGTVDKFQGQEAAVAIYSTASSSAEDAPRGVNFLYDLHRLNVAISRARCMAIVVSSPALLDAAVRNPEQLRAVNGLISVAEAASERRAEVRAASA